MDWYSMPPAPHYRNPPILEALCEVAFAPHEWDDTVPGDFYARVRDQFPVKEQLGGTEAEVSLGPGSSASVGLRPVPGRLRFYSPGRDRLIQLAPNLLVVNKLRPYTSFADWAGTLAQAVDHYRDVVPGAMVARVTVRYLNRITIPGRRVALEQYFRVMPVIPPTLGTDHGAFLLRLELLAPEPDHHLVLSFATAPAEQPDSLTFLLDYHDAWQPATPRPPDQVQAQARVAHGHIRMAFEQNITDDLRRLFS
jgi:uncharacterized protein (TIGR04255 family)